LPSPAGGLPRFALFRAVIDRSKVLSATGAALGPEPESPARDAGRRAELLRQADRYQEEGLTGSARHLRQQAEGLSARRPLAGVLPAVVHWQAGLPGTRETPESPATDKGTLPGPDAPASRPALPPW
jgi:hypothetical protein